MEPIQTKIEVRSVTFGSKEIECPICGDRLKARGLKGHIKWKHEQTPDSIHAELAQLRNTLTAVKKAFPNLREREKDMMRPILGKLWSEPN